MKKGDLIWQQRMPGGACVYMGEVTKETTKYSPAVWTENDEPVLLVLHPTEGLIEDPSYYYSTIEDYAVFERRHLRYLLKEAGKVVPKWLQREIEKDESLR
jgi:hypothetical protein|tara:strand:- start:449 stop:751 length:303 start_codon:yes stop_codon:yes gene_type:complete